MKGRIIAGILFKYAPHLLVYLLLLIFFISLFLSSLYSPFPVLVFSLAYGILCKGAFFFFFRKLHLKGQESVVCFLEQPHVVNGSVSAT